MLLRLQIHRPKLSAEKPAVCARAQQIVQPLAVAGETRKRGVTLRSNLAFAARVMNPQRTLAVADGRDEPLPIRRKTDSLLFGGAGSNLFRLTIGKSLPPDVVAVSGIGGKIHPF